MAFINNIFFDNVKGLKFVLLCLMIGTASINLHSQEMAYVTVTAANLRDKPNGDIIMQLPYGTRVNIKKTENSWHEIEINTNSIQGFIHKSIISYSPLVEPEFDNKNIEALKLIKNGFEDKHIIRMHTFPDYSYDDLIKPTNEKFEQFLYWKTKKPSAKHYIFNMDIMVERTRRNTYNNTPCQIFNQSKNYKFTNETYNNELVTTPTHREFEKPHIKKSYFNIKPGNYLISNIVERQDSLFFGNYFASTKLIHLLRIYFKEENSFELLNKNGTVIYTSLQKIRFFTTDEKGENIIENSGEITYLPGRRNKICVTNLDIPYNKNMTYIYFCSEELIDKHLLNKINIAKTTKTINGWFEFDVYEFDFNSDGVIDLLRSFELCPEEAGDSSDEVYYFNINGKWKSMLATRAWCIP